MIFLQIDTTQEIAQDDESCVTYRLAIGAMPHAFGWYVVS